MDIYSINSIEKINFTLAKLGNFNKYFKIVPITFLPTNTPIQGVTRYGLFHMLMAKYTIN
jgi:hypothetical protein